MRVLVTVSPKMYREAVDASIQHAPPGIEVRGAPPEDAELELAGFRPRLLVQNDTAPISEREELNVKLAEGRSTLGSLGTVRLVPQ